MFFGNIKEGVSIIIIRRPLLFKNNQSVFNKTQKAHRQTGNGANLQAVWWRQKGNV